jgi:hypothetical protein
MNARAKWASGLGVEKWGEYTYPTSFLASQRKGFSKL